jgi:hypothetical protein
MSQKTETNSSFTTAIINTVSIAVLAALAEQVMHEVSHGLATLFVGANWDALNLFASYSSWNGAADPVGQFIISGNAAIVNVIAGSLCLFLFSRSWLIARPLFRLFILYFGAYSLLAGFGYLLVDPLFYKPGANLGDWKQVVAYFGGGWAVRIFIFSIGAIGTFAAFIWISRSALCFCTQISQKKMRVKTVFRILLMPYILVNIIFTVLAFWHPLGPNGTILTIFKYWFGYIGLFWAFFIAGYWMKTQKVTGEISGLPPNLALKWNILAIICLVTAITVLLPTLQF